MQEPTSSEPATTGNISDRGGWLSSVTRLGAGPWIALTFTCIAWFSFDTLRMEWGPLSHGAHFYDMADVIDQPSRLFNGLEAHRGGITTVLFILLCVAALMAPAALSVRRSRFAWVGCCAPLALMVCVAVILKARTSGDLIQESRLVDTLGNDFRHLANHAFRSVGATVAQTVTIGSGAYVAVLSSSYLAWWGLQRTRKRFVLVRKPK